MQNNNKRGLSLIGILITLACVVALMSIYLLSASKSISGSKGKSSSTSAWGMIDKIQLLQIGNALRIDSEMNGQYLTPSKLSRSGDIRDNTSANFWSAMILQRLLSPEALVSKTDPGWVEKAQPDYRARFWDPNFSADLSTEFNISFAHMPLWEDRLEKKWNSSSRTFPLLSNRGPQDGIEHSSSITLDDDGIWRGWVYFSDHSIDWVEGTTITAKWRRSDDVQRDTIFLDESDTADDAMLGYTLEMDDNGPTYSWD